jgi:hypothetical protein
MPEHLLDTLGAREKALEALADAVKECAKESAKEVGKEYAKELAGHAAGKAISPLATELAQAVGGELTRAVAGAFVGPLVGILFKVVDDTKARINKILSEPERTAVREARRFLELPSDSPADTVLIEEKFAAVSDAFDRAYTFAQGERDAKARMLWIRMMQGLIARRRGGSAVARLYFQECFELLKGDYADLAIERRAIDVELERYQNAIQREINNPPAKATVMRPPSGPMNARGLEIWLDRNLDISSSEEDRGREAAHQERINRLRKHLEAERRKLSDVQNTENFIAVVRELAANPFQ